MLPSPSPAPSSSSAQPSWPLPFLPTNPREEGGGTGRSILLSLLRRKGVQSLRRTSRNLSFYNRKMLLSRSQDEFTGKIRILYRSILRQFVNYAYIYRRLTLFGIRWKDADGFEGNVALYAFHSFILQLCDYYLGSIIIKILIVIKVHFQICILIWNLSCCLYI